jgi:MFS family permease
LVAALLVFVHIGTDSSYWSILPGLLIMPFGLGLSFVSITIAATTGIPPGESGLASGLLNTAQQIGGSVGLAILSGVAASATAASLALGTGQAQAAVDGFHNAFYVGILFAIGASLIAAFFIKPIHSPRPEAAMPPPQH